MTNPASGITYNRNWNVVTNGNVRTITITISWTDQVLHSFTLTSMICQ
jgi:hypothetical protein